LYLPRAVSTAAHTSSQLVGTAGRAAKAAAKEAAAAAPTVTRRAMNAAERAMPKSPSVNEASEPLPSDAEIDAAVAAIEAHGAKDKDKDAGLLTGPGFVTVYSRLPMQVYADGKCIGTSDDGQLMLPSGMHRLEFANERFRYRSEPTALKILPGHVHPYNVVLPTVDVHVTTTPGAEVWVEGKRVGVARADSSGERHARVRRQIWQRREAAGRRGEVRRLAGADAGPAKRREHGALAAASRPAPVASARFAS